MVRLRDITPPPHGAVHDVHSVKSDTSHSAGQGGSMPQGSVVVRWGQPVGTHGASPLVTLRIIKRTPSHALEQFPTPSGRGSDALRERAVRMAGASSSEEGRNGEVRHGTSHVPASQLTLPPSNGPQGEPSPRGSVRTFRKRVAFPSPHGLLQDPCTHGETTQSLAHVGRKQGL